jgi:hypothetical protein
LHIATLRRARPDITIEIRWCPANKGVPGNETADEWAKLAAEKSDARRVEWKQYKDRYGRRPMPLPRSLADLKRDISEKKWQEANMWADSRVTRKKYQYCRREKVCQKPDSAPAKCNKILWAAVRKETGRGKYRFKVRDLFADSRCSQAILEFLSPRMWDEGAEPDRAEEGVQSETSEGEIGEQEEKAEGKEAEDPQQERGLVRNEGGFFFVYSYSQEAYLDYGGVHF